MRGLMAFELMRMPVDAMVGGVVARTVVIDGISKLKGALKGFEWMRWYDYCSCDEKYEWNMKAT